MAVSCTSLREKGDMLLSRATADREKEPQGGEGERSATRPGGLSPPGVWRGRVAQQAQRAIGAGGCPSFPPPNSLQSPPVSHHYGYSVAPRTHICG